MDSKESTWSDVMSIRESNFDEKITKKCSSNSRVTYLAPMESMDFERSPFGKMQLWIVGTLFSSQKGTCINES